MHNTRIINRKLLILVFTFVLIHTAYSKKKAIFFDFSAAKIFTEPELSETEEAALKMLIEEVESRSNILLPATSDWPSSSTPVIVVGTKKYLEGLYGPFSQSSVESMDTPTEGFTIKLLQNTREDPTLFVIGNDSRGMLFGIGYLLRKVSMNQSQINVPENINITTHPSVPLRGHQAAYRPKTNSYDGFTIDMWEQYIRDLIVFGTNSIELLPPDTDDADGSPMFPRSQMEMMIKMNKLLTKYGLNTWIWYPLMYDDYTNSDEVQESLKKAGNFFSKLSKINALFIPGGDPGNTPPGVLFDYLEKQAKILQKYHPEAEIWVSPQSFYKNEMDLFLELVREEPEWLTSIVYGPQVRLFMDQLREVIPDKYPIRRYPDITHNYDSQYPVPNVDPENRINKDNKILILIK